MQFVENCFMAKKNIFLSFQITFQERTEDVAEKACYPVELCISLKHQLV